MLNVTPEPIEARRIRVRGVVQGVGFRPFVYRLAVERKLHGWVLNDEAGVEIHVQGPAEAIGRFALAVRNECPPAARVIDLECRPVELLDADAFRILESRHGEAPTTRMSPDLAVCEACLAEMFDEGDRRHGYAYINCTHCGPRYSIIHHLPYDRAATTMADWAMCPRCRGEYDDPVDRRFHAQPTACPECGPAYRFEVWADPGEGEEGGQQTDAVARAARALADGRIVAVKGIGGYHLACDAGNADAVERLRARKFRKEKPFALMVRDPDEARRLVELTGAHQELLGSAARPIVLARARVELPGVAPDTDELGLMLPYAPLHDLLFACGAPSPLVMTSANRSSEPIAYRDDDARERLAGIADAALVGERPIARRVDDSVVAVRSREPLMIRRSRGYAPGTVARLPGGRPILALGADLKDTIPLVVDGEVVVSPYIGDLGDLESNRAFEETVRDLLAMYEVGGRDLVVVHDLHPQFESTRLAGGLACRERVAVQHHEAHVASVLAEHDRLDEHVVGVALDGTGWGRDGTIWGFEFFTGSVREGFQRQSWLQPVAMPGGDAAARYPLQAAAAFFGEDAGIDFRQPPFGFGERFFLGRQLVAKNVRCHTSTSAGRLFDAAAAVLGFDREVSFEGQAAIWLEHTAGVASSLPLDFGVLDGCRLLRQVVDARLADRPIAEIASAFHAAIAREIAARAAGLAQEQRLETVVVSGGVFQNRLLLALVERELAERAGLRLLRNVAVPPNDGGIALGQAALARFGSA